MSIRTNIINKVNIYKEKMINFAYPNFTEMNHERINPFAAAMLLPFAAACGKQQA